MSTDDRGRMPGGRYPLALAFSFLAMASALAGCGSAQVQPSRLPVELRGVWLTNVDSRVLDSRANIAEAMQFLADNNFNVVYPVVWNKALTLYPSEVMRKYFGAELEQLPGYRGRDPLAEVIEEAHKRGIAVIPWFEYGFAASYNQEGGHIIRAKPGWAARDSGGKLLKKNGFEWLNAFDPEVQEFMLALVTEVAQKYEADGVQGDDRLPAQPIEGGYDPVTSALYKEQEGAAPPSDFRDARWKRWRAARLSAFGRELYRRVKAAKPGLMVSWAPSVYPWSLEEYLQDWRSWADPAQDGGAYADLVHPQIYRYGMAQYGDTLDTQLPGAMGVGARAPYLYPGILLSFGKYLMDEDYLKEAVRYNRRRGCNGEVFFFYEGLRKENDRRAKVLKENFYRTPAQLPFIPLFRRTYEPAPLR
ncbi:MAG: family 10 glycosylhydrolase [Elusimicrobiota bacterium]